MPTYTFKNKITGVEWDKEMRIAELDDYVKENGCSIVISAPMIISQTGDNIDAKTDSGWKETLSKISEAHPASELANQYGKRKSAKDVKTAEVIKKHKTIAERRINKIIQLK